MANYPTSVYNPTTHQTGDTIQATHINTPDAEIAAIENGLLTGLQHALTISTGGLTVSTGSVNVGGPSSFATLQVNGASTLATVQVTGGSTFATVNITGGSTFAVRPIFTPPDAARVALQSTSALGDGVSLVLNWVTGDYLTNSSMFSSPSSALTPQSTGIYEIVAQVAFSPSPGGDRSVRVLDSSNAIIGRQHVAASSHASSPTVLNVVTTKRYDAIGGHVKVQVYQASASTLSVIVADSFFELRKL